MTSPDPVARPAETPTSVPLTSVPPATPVLTDTQLVMLSQASQRADGRVVPPSHLKGGVIRRVMASLAGKGLVAPVPVTVAGCEGVESFPVISAAGLAAIGVSDEVDAAENGGAKTGLAQPERDEPPADPPPGANPAVATASPIAAASPTASASLMAAAGSVATASPIATAGAIVAASHFVGVAPIDPIASASPVDGVGPMDSPSPADLTSSLDPVNSVGRAAHFPAAGADHTMPSAVRTPRVGSKQGLVVELLARPEGASLAQIVEATGWQAHTTRAVLSGLRKRGHAIERIGDRTEGSRYRLAAALGMMGCAVDGAEAGMPASVPDLNIDDTATGHFRSPPSDSGTSASDTSVPSTLLSAAPSSVDRA